MNMYLMMRIIICYITRELAEEYGIHNWRRVPALNTDPMFIKDMANLVVEALEAPAGSFLLRIIISHTPYHHIS